MNKYDHDLQKALKTLVSAVNHNCSRQVTQLHIAAAVAEAVGDGDQGALRLAKRLLAILDGP